MSNPLSYLQTERVRAYIYRVLTVAGGVALFYGLLTAEELAVWSGLVATLFVLPAVNTSTQK